MAVSGASARYATSFVPRSALSLVMRVRAAVSDPGLVLTRSHLLGPLPGVLFSWSRKSCGDGRTGNAASRAADGRRHQLQERQRRAAPVDEGIPARRGIRSGTSAVSRRHCSMPRCGVSRRPVPASWIRPTSRRGGGCGTANRSSTPTPTRLRHPIIRSPHWIRTIRMPAAAAITSRMPRSARTAATSTRSTLTPGWDGVVRSSRNDVLLRVRSPCRHRCCVGARPTTGGARRAVDEPFAGWVEQGIQRHARC